MGGNTSHHCVGISVREFDNLTGIDIHQVIMIVVTRYFVAGAFAAQVTTLQYAVLLEEAHGTINGGERNVLVDVIDTSVQFADIWMVSRL